MPIFSSAFGKEKPVYTSKTKRGECKNDACKEKRRDASAYCQKCSDNKKVN